MTLMTNDLNDHDDRVVDVSRSWDITETALGQHWDITGTVLEYY